MISGSVRIAPIALDLPITNEMNLGGGTALKLSIYRSQLSILEQPPDA
jgi:hypothetical protein